MISPLRPVNATADIDPALMQQGTVHSCSTGAVIRADEFILDVSGAGGYPWDLGARLGLHSTTDATVGAIGRVRMGESLTAPGVGTVYLIELQAWHGSQLVKILFIPETN